MKLIDREKKLQLIKYLGVLAIMSSLQGLISPKVVRAEEDFLLNSKVFTFHFESGGGVESVIRQMNAEGRINTTAFGLVSALQERKQMPPSYVLSLDDGYSMQMKVLDPLAKHDVKATFFYIPWEGDGVHSYLTPNQIKQISDAGHDVGCHTRNHPADLPVIMKRNWGDYLNQVVGAKRTIEDITGKPVVTFAYPYGVTSPELATDLANYYLGAFTTQSGYIHQLSRAMMLPRISVN